MLIRIGLRKKRRLLIRLITLGLLCCLVGCGTSSPETPTVPISTVTVPVFTPSSTKSLSTPIVPFVFTDEMDGERFLLCGMDSENHIVVYDVSFSKENGIGIDKVMQLPGVAHKSEVQANRGLCPELINRNVAWLYGHTYDQYERDIYLMDLQQRTIRLWFHLTGNDGLEDVALFSGLPQALIISGRDQDTTCGEAKQLEGRWSCLLSKGDIYSVDHRGEISRITTDQAPLCSAQRNPERDIIAYRQSSGCMRHDPEAATHIVLWTQGMTKTLPVEGWFAQWSPDGRFLSSQEPALGDRSVAFHLFDTDTGQVTTAKHDPELNIVDFGFLKWSSDSQWVAWDNRSLDQNHLSHYWMNVYEVETGSIVRIASEGIDNWKWSLDSQSLAWRTDSSFTFNVAGSESISSVPVEIGELFDWTFDQTILLYIDRSKPDSIYVLDRSSNAIGDLSMILSIENVSWLKVAQVK